MTLNPTADEDVIMHSNDSGAATPTRPPQPTDPPPDPESVSWNRSPTPVDIKDTIMAEESAPAPSLDLLDRISGMYRLLDLVSEQSSNGVVDKVLIAQESVKQFANFIHPGSYRSETLVDFRALDTHTIKPKGLYGSMSAIIDFLQGLGCIDNEIRNLLLHPRDEYSGVFRPSLRPGLYALCSPKFEENLIYVIFWPEDTTWKDGAISSVSRNRVTFMRYLTKLCEQLVCLISDEHSAQLVWKDGMPEEIEDDETESFDDRMFGFTVEQTNEEEEGTTEEEGFTIRHHSINMVTEVPPDYPSDRTLGALRSKFIVGETTQAILQPQFLPGKVRPTSIDRILKSVAFKDLLSAKQSPNVILGDKLDHIGLKVLLDKGDLWTRCGSLRQEWSKQERGIKNKFEEDRKSEKNTRRNGANKDAEMLEQNFAVWLTKQAANYYPILPYFEIFKAIFGEDSKDKEDDHYEAAITKVESWFDHQKDLAKKVNKDVHQEFRTLESNPHARYSYMKRRFQRIMDIIKGPSTPELSQETVTNLIALVTTNKNFEEELGKMTTPVSKEDQPSRWSSIVSGVTGLVPGFGTWSRSSRKSPDIPAKPYVRHPIPALEQQDDFAFASALQSISDQNDTFKNLGKEFKDLMVELLKQKIRRLSHSIPQKIKETLYNSIDQELSKIFEQRRQTADEVAWQTLKGKVQEYLLNPNAEDSSTLRIDHVKQESSKSSYGVPDSYHLCGSVLTPTRAGFEYTLYPLDVKADDINDISTNENHICNPVVRSQVPRPFILPLHHRLRYMRLLEKDRCLVVIEDLISIYIYLEPINNLASAIDTEKIIKRFYLEKTGKRPLFTVDEAKKQLVMVSILGASVLLHVYAYDLDTRSLGARGSPVNITQWYQGIPSFIHLLFVTGTEELLLVEKSGLCRIFSLVTQNFRPSTLHIEGTIEAAFSSSDGACLFTKIIRSDGCYIACHHWASFGGSTGKEIPWPNDIPVQSQMAVSSVGSRTSTYLIFLNPEDNLCTSLHIHITRKSSEFAFRSTMRRNDSAENSKHAVNNSLIDCHAEVWTRFPVQAPISREMNDSAIRHPRSMVFVSTAPPSSFPPYFSTMVKDFEYNTRKPTKGLLAQIRVTGQDHWNPMITTSTSELQVGDWLVGLFCLIPIHLAITDSNRFVPLKDGVISPQFEQTLLGANVAQICEALSFGWYESIFSSYLANKPVKVVTSMGEQSVGKSFALNHFVDTSFAGSAMRCTEGVWLSVTPTRDYLVVAMDFEGVHSIERSAQEDTLLVLLNAAISNLVLFRNNFALSRDIAGLFTSFQSCTTVLDPASNRSLFHSTLGIIIKDVIDSDTKEIVNEFRQKFQRMVRQEKGDNFITKLHKGNLDIIPWPVIQSARFYDLFYGLKKRLDMQSVTHPHAGGFITVLKMLMAKLKANDWGALDQNLAAQRSQQLGSVLLFALSLGTTDSLTGEQLKNYDTDEPIANEDNPAQFYLEGVQQPDATSASPPECLRRLRMGWPDRVLRFTVPEPDFFQKFNAYLAGLAEERIKHVSSWLKANTSRFGDNAEILGLLRTFDGLAKDLRRSVELCGSKCSSCGLLCLDHKRHDGDHNCMTAHRCPEQCGFAEQHSEDDVPECDLPAGHTGRHVCTGTPHLCSMPCHLYGKNECLGRCTKPMGHDEDEGHLCAASVHTCGELCSLVKEDGTRLCSRPCVVDCRREHELHSCDRSLSCPLKCQLCNSFCAVGDHFHALQADAVHLCGQPHGCTQLCELPGICEIATTPQSIESTFVGRHAKFQYTKYTQEARRLRCIIPIDSDKLDHDSPHVHSKDPAAFHFCEEKCRHCEYYCTLPLNHQQKEHETSHGSMSNTEWIIEGDDDATLELDGHKYATGDSGAPMLCSMVCKTLGRHVHIDSCRPDDEGRCIGAGIKHFDGRRGRDWITHRLFWARSGFRDPYTRTEQVNFDLCDHRCGGEEHDPDVNHGAVPSFCTLPLFHQHADPAAAPPLGHISHDGHSYTCKNPVLSQRSFHIFFALDKSYSMTSSDRRPLPNSPATLRIVKQADNRFGAVVSSLYAFWTARDAAVRSGAAAGLRRDAYTIITFESTASVTLANDTTSNPDQLLDILLNRRHVYGGTNFTHALETVQQEMETTWTSERSPIVIFLSDGECEFQDNTIYDLCRTAVRLGKPLAFHAVSFGQDAYSQYLRRMASIAGEVYDNTPRDPLAPAGINPCSFSAALDTVQLATTFLCLAESLKNPRAALSRI